MKHITVVTLAVALLIAACGNDDSTTGGGGADSPGGQLLDASSDADAAADPSTRSIDGSPEAMAAELVEAAIEGRWAVIYASYHPRMQAEISRSDYIECEARRAEPSGGLEFTVSTGETWDEGGVRWVEVIVGIRDPDTAVTEQFTSPIGFVEVDGDWYVAEGQSSPDDCIPSLSAVSADAPANQELVDVLVQAQIEATPLISRSEAECAAVRLIEGLGPDRVRELFITEEAPYWSHDEGRIAASAYVDCWADRTFEEMFRAGMTEGLTETQIECMVDDFMALRGEFMARAIRNDVLGMREVEGEINQACGVR